MSYQIVISGHVDSKKKEAKALQAAVNLVEELEADGQFSFSGQHFNVYSSAPGDAVGRARAALEAYAAVADEDDQVEEEGHEG